MYSYTLMNRYIKEIYVLVPRVSVTKLLWVKPLHVESPQCRKLFEQIIIYVTCNMVNDTHQLR